MNIEENKKIHIRPFNKAWKIEDSIYAIGNFQLPSPVEFRAAGYFVFILGIMLILTRIGVIPVLSWSAYVIIPMAVTQFLAKKKLDGRPPHKYFISLVRYFFTKRNVLERFRVINKRKDSRVRLNWYCSRGNYCRKGW